MITVEFSRRRNIFRETSNTCILFAMIKAINKNRRNDDMREDERKVDGIKLKKQ